MTTTQPFPPCAGVHMFTLTKHVSKSPISCMLSPSYYIACSHRNMNTSQHSKFRFTPDHTSSFTFLQLKKQECIWKQAYLWINYLLRSEWLLFSLSSFLQLLLFFFLFLFIFILLLLLFIIFFLPFIITKVWDLHVTLHTCNSCTLELETSFREQKKQPPLQDVLQMVHVQLQIERIQASVTQLTTASRARNAVNTKSIN